jgi:hypothetical protein
MLTKFISPVLLFVRSHALASIKLKSSSSVHPQPLILFAKRGSCGSSHHFGALCFSPIWRPELGYSGFPLFLMTAGRQFFHCSLPGCFPPTRNRILFADPLSLAMAVSAGAQRVFLHVACQTIGNSR